MPKAIPNCVKARRLQSQIKELEERKQRWTSHNDKQERNKVLKRYDDSIERRNKAIDYLNENTQVVPWDVIRAKFSFDYQHVFFRSYGF